MVTPTRALLLRVVTKAVCFGTLENDDRKARTPPVMAAPTSSVPQPKLKEYIFTDKLGSGTYATVFKAYRKVRRICLKPKVRMIFSNY